MSVAVVAVYAAVFGYLCATAHGALTPAQQWGLKWGTTWNKQNPLSPYRIVAIHCEGHPPTGYGCSAILARRNGNPAPCYQSWAVNYQGHVLIASKVVCDAKGAA